MTSQTITPELEALVERVLERKLDERFGELQSQLAAIERRMSSCERQATAERATLLVFSGEMDPLMAAFIIASASIAMGLEVTMYFTFWGLNALRKTWTFKGKTLPEKMIAALLPKSVGRLATSRLNMAGIGPAFFKKVMDDNNVEDLPSLIEVARDLGVRMVACEMTMGVMGIKREELVDWCDYGGAATYLEHAADSKLTLFI
ncbi:MAG: DsrE/DsrF/DrsH-like family protein [Myxococcales bacterium]|nr:DsrE/DsrF/DrsH-like family protein [Myxococcales bacterium]